MIKRETFTLEESTMLTWFKKLLWDETAGLRFGRTLLGIMGALLTAWQINGELTPGIIVSAILGASGTILGAGERIPKEAGGAG